MDGTLAYSIIEVVLDTGYDLCLCFSKPSRRVWYIYNFANILFTNQCSIDLPFQSLLPITERPQDNT